MLIRILLSFVLFLFFNVVAPVGAQTPASQTATMNLSWTDNSDNEDGFVVERRTGQTGVFEQIASLQPNTLTYTDTILGDPGGVEYCYRVGAFNTAGTSFSNIACATTPTIVIPPNPPSGVKVTVTVTVEVQ